jgi:hypothetical protein
MKPFREWSFARITLVGAGWVVLGAALIGLWIFLHIASTADIGPGGGIETVHFSINGSMLLIPAGSPIALMLAWLIARVRR